MAVGWTLGEVVVRIRLFRSASFSSRAPARGSSLRIATMSVDDDVPAGVRQVPATTSRPALTGMYSVVAEAVGPDRAGMAQGVNSLIFALGSATGSAATTSLLSAHLIPHTPLSVASGYTNSYILCGLLGVVAVAAPVTEARLPFAVQNPLPIRPGRSAGRPRPSRGGSWRTRDEGIQRADVRRVRRVPRADPRHRARQGVR